MNIADTTEKLSTQEYWDKVLEDAKLPRENTAGSYLYNITMKYIKPVLQSANYTSFFEVGCGSSGWLPYFAKKYNYKVSGLDYSEVGCKLARKNLELLNIDYGEILCRDFFQPDPTSGKTYDVVFSYGVIEHFSDPVKVAGIFKSFTAPGGIMITLIPNFMGTTAILTKRFMKNIYDIHNIITPQVLAEFHTKNGMEIIKNGYAGIYSFAVVPWIRSTHPLFKEGSFSRKVLLFLIKATDKVLGTLFRILPFDIPSKMFSPYIICIAKNKSE